MTCASDGQFELERSFTFSASRTGPAPAYVRVTAGTAEANEREHGPWVLATARASGRPDISKDCRPSLSPPGPPRPHWPGSAGGDSGLRAPLSASPPGPAAVPGRRRGPRGVTVTVTTSAGVIGRRAACQSRCSVPGSAAVPAGSVRPGRAQTPSRTRPPTPCPRATAQLPPRFDSDAAGPAPAPLRGSRAALPGLSYTAQPP